MIAANPRPRSIISIIFIGFFLGPFFGMLWLGRGRLALIYLLLTIFLAFMDIALESMGWVSPTPFIAIPPTSFASLVSTLIFNVVGILHSLYIRTTSIDRPWFRWIASVPASVTAVTLVLFWPTRVLLFQPFNIPAKSSEPNLILGDHVFVSKTAYGYSRFSFPFNLANFEGRTGGSHPQRGDLAVFRLPSDTSIDYVKRVIGLPGDHVQMIAGVLNINGRPVKLEKVELAPEFHRENGMTFFREILPEGRSYVIASSLDGGPADNTQEYAVPPGHYFMLGDNRDNSMDSRYLQGVGYVPEENFIGPVVFRFWNTEGVSLSGRPEEIYPSN